MTAPKSELLLQIGRGLRAAREALARTQDEVAERAGFTGKYISEIERGLRDVPLSTLARIADQGLDGRVQVRLAHASEPPGAEPPLPSDVMDTARVLARLSPSVRARVSALVDEFADLL